MTGKTLFVSQLPLGRCENLTAVWNAYDGPKEFRLGHEGMRTAEDEGFACVVCDAIPHYIDHKQRCKVINLGHGIEGGKLYANHERWKPWFDPDAAAQTDFAITSSEETIPIVAGQLCIPESRVLPLGMPRTDEYFQDIEPMMGRETGLIERVYLYAPTFRGGDGWLPRINWARLDKKLSDGELFVIKRHYFTDAPLLDREYRHLLELDMSDPSAFALESCDVLVTDYSSIMFDAYLLGKPSILLVDDDEQYLSKRGMYYPYPEFYSSRYMRVEWCEAILARMLREAADEGMTEVEQRCIETVAGACDGHSTERVCDLVRSIV